MDLKSMFRKVYERGDIFVKMLQFRALPDLYIQQQKLAGV